MYVIDAGVAVCAVLLNVPPPETIDHAPVVALPPTLAPANAKAIGEADRHTVFGSPAVAVGAAKTLTTLSAIAALQLVPKFEVRRRVTVPE